MEVHIERVSSLVGFDLDLIDHTFDISARVAEPYDESLSCTLIRTEPVSPQRIKTYPREDEDSIKGSDLASSLILVDLDTDGHLRGYLRASKAWNNMVFLDEIIIDRPCRQLGIARLLMASLQAWTIQVGLSAIKVETQDTNVGANSFYRSLAFSFGGYDKFMYYGIEACRDETALYWYWFSQSPG
ncbi:hypothetical protein BD324DRAFT_649673 [Kockovaella imperatae]|uniref:N-acetyltransferase domain-containing protein n=1 Tax=Kockovaella imperatae TaxID=4999 RepID=A0A1Y1UJS1_9TREE|nr:hypothetical protein BD324DRAFT_649673 [Kockovaella imperatae]ORX38298.1 hypothetical protein BD324DRAFT_649673 [Kockovaella imperatae]